ncbi:hypothetical protein MC885_004156, partial [Smutsia gigantea]
SNVSVSELVLRKYVLRRFKDRDAERERDPKGPRMAVRSQGRPPCLSHPPPARPAARGRGVQPATCRLGACHPLPTFREGRPRPRPWGPGSRSGAGAHGGSQGAPPGGHMCVRRYLVGLTFCTCYLASYLTNKNENYQGEVGKNILKWQTLIGGLLLHVSWKLGWTEINSSSRSDVLMWLPASVLFVGIIYAGSRALSRLAIPVFLTLHNVAEVIISGHQKCFQKEKISPAKICSALFLLAAAGCLPFNDPQFDPDGYFWAVIHVFCVACWAQHSLKPSKVVLVSPSWLWVTLGGRRGPAPCGFCVGCPVPVTHTPLFSGAYKILQKPPKPNALSDIDQQYLNYIFSVVLLAFASHPTGDLLSVLDFPFLYFYRFHGSCCASGFLGFFLMLSTVRLKSLMAPGQCAAWIFFAKVRKREGLGKLLPQEPL